MARALKLVAVTFAMLTAAMLGNSDARAGGYGAYLEGAISKSNQLKRDIALNATQPVDRNFEAAMGGFGFIYDTNLSRDTALNYRYKIGYRIGSRRWDYDGLITLPRRNDREDPNVEPLTFLAKPTYVQGVSFDTTLGYGFIRTPSYRVWAGPNLRLNVDWFDVATDVDVVSVGVGGGLEIGINYHLNDRVSLSTSLAYDYLFLSEYFETIGNDVRVDGGQHFLALTISIMFRSESDFWGE